MTVPCKYFLFIFWKNIRFCESCCSCHPLIHSKVCYILCRGLYFLMFLSLSSSPFCLSLSHTHTHVLSFLAQRKNETLCSRHRKLQCVRDAVFNNSYRDNHERENERGKIERARESKRKRGQGEEDSRVFLDAACREGVCCKTLKDGKTEGICLPPDCSAEHLSSHIISCHETSIPWCSTAGQYWIDQFWFVVSQTSWLWIYQCGSIYNKAWPFYYFLTIPIFFPTLMRNKNDLVKPVKNTSRSYLTPK